MKKIFFALFFLLSSIGFAQKSVWGGFAFQNDRNRLESKYPMVITMSQSGSKIKGTTYFTFPDDPSVFVKMRYSGYKKNDTLYLKEVKIMEATHISGEWLTKDIVLYEIEEDGIFFLYGTWKAHANSVSNGTMKLKKANLVD